MTRPVNLTIVMNIDRKNTTQYFQKPNAREITGLKTGKKRLTRQPGCFRFDSASKPLKPSSTKLTTMGRLVRVKQPANQLFKTADQPQEQQTYLEQVIKYIPTEIVGGYVAVNSLLASLPADMLNNWLWGTFILFALGTPVYFWLMKKPGDAIWQQMILSFISFIIWAYSITGASGIFGTAGIDIYYSQIASALLIILSIAAPLFTPNSQGSGGSN